MNKKLIGLIILVFMLPLIVALAGYNDPPGLSSPVSFTPQVALQNDVNNNTANDEHPRGQLLYENHCRGCHEKSVHSRTEKSAKSKDDIKYWVIRWATELKLEWSTEDVDDVVDYLDKTFYQ